jgi:hypothetical protein
MVTQTGKITSPRRLPEFFEPWVVSFETDIDDSIQTETTAWEMLRVKATAPAVDVVVEFDLDKATTGFGTVESSCTITFQVARAIDGTNYKVGAFQPATALSGTLAATNRSVEVAVGDMEAGETVIIMCTLSADATSDMEIPGRVRGKGKQKPVVTAVAAV